jgi:hypothetical protein
VLEDVLTGEPDRGKMMCFVHERSGLWFRLV